MSLAELVATINAVLTAALPGSSWQGLVVPVRRQNGQSMELVNVDAVTGNEAFLNDAVTTNGFHRADEATYQVATGMGAGNAYRKRVRVSLLLYSTDRRIADKVETLLAPLAHVTLIGAVYDPGRVNALLLGLRPQTYDAVERTLALITYEAHVTVARCLP